MKKLSVEIEIDEPSGRTLSYVIRYPGETQYNSREKIQFSRDSRESNGDAIIARNKNSQLAWGW